MEDLEKASSAIEWPTWTAVTYKPSDLIRKSISGTASIAWEGHASLSYSTSEHVRENLPRPVAVASVPAGQTLAPSRRREFISGLGSALSRWRHETGVPFTELAREAGVRRGVIDHLVNGATMKDGPKDSSFYEKLYQIEVRFPGYFTREVVRLLIILTNRYTE